MAAAAWARCGWRGDGRFDGQAALKRVNLAMLDRAGQERFRREGTALARLSHPNIARLLDAGVTATGQPYLVLEYVDGERIDHFAARQRLDVAARLRLFLQTADAVAHAHANLVVHRDLKPSNVLVDASGQVKLLDFGIAKLIADGGADEARPLEVTELVLTPEFAAPEQVVGGDITTATDVYALGIVLISCSLDDIRRPRQARCIMTCCALNETAPPFSAISCACVSAIPTGTAWLPNGRRHAIGSTAPAGAISTPSSRRHSKKAPAERYQTVTVRRRCGVISIVSPCWRPDSAWWSLAAFRRATSYRVRAAAVLRHAS